MVLWRTSLKWNTVFNQVDPIWGQKCAAACVKVFTHGSLASLQRRADTGALIDSSRDFRFSSTFPKSTLICLAPWTKPKVTHLWRFQEETVVYFGKVSSGVLSLELSSMKIYSCGIVQAFEKKLHSSFRCLPISSCEKNWGWVKKCNRVKNWRKMQIGVWLKIGQGKNGPNCEKWAWVKKWGEK